MNLQRYLIFGLLYWYFFSSSAQILNIERHRNYDDTLRHWKGFILSQIDVQKQQIQTFHFGLNENVTFHGRKHNFALISEAHLLKVRGRNVLSNGYAHVRANFLKRRKLSYEVFTQAQYDQARGMRERYLLGGGTRLYYEISSKTYVAIGNGLMYEYEHWVFEKKDTTTFLLKTTNYVSLHYATNQLLDIVVTAYYQAFPRHLSRPRIIGDFQLDIKLTKHFRYNIRYNLQYDAAPVVPILPTIYSLRNAIRYDF